VHIQENKMQEVKFDDTANKGLGEKAKELASTVVGMTLEAAVKVITASECEHRVAEQDGEGSALTMDYRFDRLNLVVADGSVTDARVG
jgi:hypothetical protein